MKFLVDHGRRQISSLSKQQQQLLYLIVDEMNLAIGLFQSSILENEVANRTGASHRLINNLT